MKRKDSNVKKEKGKQPHQEAPEPASQPETGKKQGEQSVGSENGEKDQSETREEVIDWQLKYNEINDKYLRLYSEFDNYRRRTAREKLEMAKTASEEVISELLPVMDDFERALKVNDSIAECDAVKEGMTLIYNKISGILLKKGLKAIEATGNEFSTDFHEAITYIEAPADELKGKVVDVIEKGYTLHDKVIRFAKVVIGK